MGGCGRGGRVDRPSFIGLYHPTDNKGHQSRRPSHSSIQSDIHKAQFLRLICGISLAEPMGKRRSEYRVLVAKPQVKSTLGGHKRRWEENFKIFLQGSERVDLAQDREKGWAFTNTVRNHRVPDSTGVLISP